MWKRAIWGVLVHERLACGSLLWEFFAIVLELLCPARQGLILLSLSKLLRESESHPINTGSRGHPPGIQGGQYPRVATAEAEHSKVDFCS